MKFEYNVPKPFNLKNTVKSHGWFQLVPFYWDEFCDTLHWAIDLNEHGPIAISVKEISTNTNDALLYFECTGPSIPDRDDVIRQFRHICNLDLELTDFYQLCLKHPVLYSIPEQGMGRLMRSPNVFQDVFKSICGTNVMWKQAVKMVNSIATLGDIVSGTEYRLFPSPQQIIDAGESFLKDVGRVGYRSAYLMDLSYRYCDTTQNHDEIILNHNGYSELLNFFTSHKGIGKITARYLCALYGKYDELSIDSLVITYMTRVYFNGTKPDVEQIENIFSEYGKWKYLVYWMEFLINKGWDPDA